jgi:hypothetical protein
MAKTVIGVFEGLSQAEKAVAELEDNGFTREDIGLITNNPRAHGHLSMDVIGQGSKAGDTAAGAVLGGLAGLVAEIALLAIPGIGPIIAAGPLAAGLLGAGIGATAGGLTGALKNVGIPDEEGEAYCDCVREGAVLVTANAGDRADLAAEIMNRNSAIDIDKLARRQAEGQDQGMSPARPGLGVQTGRVRRTGSGAHVFVW